MLDEPDAPALAVDEGGIEFDNVTFNYWRGKNGTVIENFDLTIAPGEKVGLVGRSGAGKSTLVNLVLRLFDVEDGCHPHRRAGRRHGHAGERARRHRPRQPGHLAAASLGAREHQVSAGRTRRDEEMIEAARTGAHPRRHRRTGSIPRAARGYDAHVGERGVKLSGGQRQRVAIARVLLKNAPILVLDEATSALDSEVEAAIQEQLQSLMQGKTVIAIAHRLSTIAAMDRLVVLEPAGSWRRGPTPNCSPAAGTMPSSGSGSRAASSISMRRRLRPPSD